MHGPHQGIGRRGQDGTRLERCPIVAPVPAVPQTGEGEWFAISAAEVPGLLLLARPLLLPLEPAVRQDQAAALAEGHAEGGLVGRRLGPGVDEAGLAILRPG